MSQNFSYKRIHDYGRLPAVMVGDGGVELKMFRRSVG